MDERNKLPDSTAVPTGAGVTDDRWQRVNLIKDITINEQHFYWNRFAGFAALNAGLVVLSLEAGGYGELASWFGLTLSVLWLYVQAISAHYIQRDKDRYSKALKAVEIERDTWKFFGRWRAPPSTRAAVSVPFVLIAFWIIRMWVGLPAPP